jgi:hypothetical protein
LGFTVLFGILLRDSSIFSLLLKWPGCAQNPSSGQDQAKKWQDRESGEVMPFATFELCKGPSSEETAFGACELSVLQFRLEKQCKTVNWARATLKFRPWGSDAWA